MGNVHALLLYIVDNMSLTSLALQWTQHMITQTKHATEDAMLSMTLATFICG